MNITLVAAMTDQKVIGSKGDLPWHLPKEFAHFKRTTMGKPVIMGRKTFESLPKNGLPGRQIYVLSRQGFSLEAALEQIGDVPEIIVAGGAEIYAYFLPKKATHMILSIVEGVYEGDTFFPAYDASEWDLEREEFNEGFKVCYYQRLKL